MDNFLFKPNFWKIKLGLYLILNIDEIMTTDLEKWENWNCTEKENVPKTLFKFFSG